MNLPGTIGPTITNAVQASTIDPSEVARARQELSDAGSEQRQAAEAVREVEAQLTTAESELSNLENEEVTDSTAAFEAERACEGRDRLLRSGASSELDYDTSLAARTSAEAAIQATRSNLLEASIQIAELEAQEVEAKNDLRVEMARRAAAVSMWQSMKGAGEAKRVLRPENLGVAPNGEVFAHAMAREADLMKLRVGQQASIVLDAKPAAHFAAHLIGIAQTPVDSPGGLLYQLTFAVEDPEIPWLTGMAMHVRLNSGARP